VLCDHARELSREEFGAAHASVEREPPVSAWWWLLPPVYFWLNHRRSNRTNKAMMKVLTPQQMSGLIDYVNKVTGWLFVGLGGVLLAIKETWLLCEHLGWPLAAYWLEVPPTGPVWGRGGADVTETRPIHCDERHLLRREPRSTETVNVWRSRVRRGVRNF
jgi:hypothetical protein